MPGDVTGLRTANGRLRELLCERAQVADLAARVSQNSKNSSKPASADGLGKPAPKSLRKKTGRRAGRPKGQPGATRMRTRRDDYLRFAHDLRVPFGNYEAEQVIRMSKLRINVSGCMRSMTGAETFCAIRSSLAIATRHGISWLDALTRAAEHNAAIL